MTINMIKTPMVDLQKTAKISLAKHGLEADGKGGVKVRLVLDHSGSMLRWYGAGAVQRLTEQVLGLASALDDDGTIETWYFGTGISETYEVSLNPTDSAVPSRRGLFGRRPRQGLVPLDPYYVGWVDRSHIRESWGSTNYGAALNAPVEFQIEQKETEPALVIFQTDGGPDSREIANHALRAYSGTNTFFAFVVFGKEMENGRLTSVGEYMRTLDNLGGRVRDNASVFFTGGLEDYASLSDEAVYDGVLGEFIKSWLPKVL
jgi:hypothetical protein